jgi:hypothetical protein
MKPTGLETNPSAAEPEFERGQDSRRPPDLKDPRVVLSFLEADQVVAAKERTHFGRRNLSLGVRAMLWGLRLYVVVMLVLVIVSALRAFHLVP